MYKEETKEIGPQLLEHIINSRDEYYKLEFTEELIKQGAIDLLTSNDKLFSRHVAGELYKLQKQEREQILTEIYKRYLQIRYEDLAIYYKVTTPEQL